MAFTVIRISIQLVLQVTITKECWDYQKKKKEKKRKRTCKGQRSTTKRKLSHYRILLHSNSFYQGHLVTISVTMHSLMFFSMYNLYVLATHQHQTERPVTSERHRGIKSWRRKCQQPPSHPQPPPLFVHGAERSAHQEARPAASSRCARAEPHLSHILISVIRDWCEELVITIYSNFLDFLCVTAVVHYTRSWSFCQKCRRQVTAKHTCTLCMWLHMKGYGAWLYDVNRTCWDGSSFMWHQPCQHLSTPLQWIFKNAL